MYDSYGGKTAAKQHFPHWRPLGKSTGTSPGGVFTVTILSISVFPELRYPSSKMLWIKTEAMTRISSHVGSGVLYHSQKSCRIFHIL